MRQAKREEVITALKKTRLWSASRPVRPEVDDIYLQIRQYLLRDTRSTWEKANMSGLSTTTIRNWETNKVKHPQGTSLQMAARLLGKRIILK